MYGQEGPGQVVGIRLVFLVCISNWQEHWTQTIQLREGGAGSSTEWLQKPLSFEAGSRINWKRPRRDGFP